MIKNNSQQDVYIKTISNEDEKLIACISKEREKKEKSIISKSEEKYLESLKKLEASISKGSIKDSKKIHTKIGRLKERHNRISRYYKVIFEDKKLQWERKDAAYEEAVEMSGGYILKSSRKDLSDEEIWHLYIMLTKVESGFRTLKSDLGLRPVFHQKKSRGDGHIFITVLAYHLLHWIETTIKRGGENISWRTILQATQTHSYTTIVLPTKNNGTIRIRKQSIPDIYQKELYKLLGVECDKLPETAIQSV
jgi:transposase